MAGRPLVSWSLVALTQAETVGSIVVALPRGVTALAFDEGFDAVEGGETRAESVRAALERVDTDVVVVHDAARPLVTPSLIDSVLRKLSDRPDADGVIAAVRIADTVKRARDLEIECTEDRERLWAAQTPQAFRAAALRAAYEADLQVTAEATDEAMLIEGAGGKVLIEPAPASNLKVTTAEDLRVAELLLGSR